MGELSCTELGRTLDPAHDELLAASRSRSVFLSADWLASWFETFGDDYESVNLAVHDGDELVGVAPFVIGPHPSIPYLRRLTIAGQHPTSGEYVDIVAKRGREDAVARAVARCLCGQWGRQWDLLFAERVLADSATLTLLAEALEEAGCAVQLLPTGSSPYCTLPASIEELMAAKSKNFRSQVRQSINRVGALGEVRLDDLDSGLTLEEGLDELVRLHRVRWGGASSFDTEQKLDFHRRLSRRLADRDRLYVSLLRVDEEAIAARYDFIFDNKLWCIQGGWDSSHSRARPGMYLLRSVIEWGIEARLREYDFLGGAADYKDRWSTGARELMTVQAAGPKTLRARFYRRRMKSAGMAADTSAQGACAARGGIGVLDGYGSSK